MVSSTPLPEDIVAAATSAIFSGPLVTNVYRSIIVEAIVAAALPDWTWCSTDYAAYDFRRGDTRLEVKQSALLQSWSKGRKSRPSWDIAARTGFYDDDSRWTDFAGRNADVYVLALHSICDETADHRDPLQWRFYAIEASALPAQKRIGLAAAERLAEAVDFEGLRTVVGALVDRLTGPSAVPLQSRAFAGEL